MSELCIGIIEYAARLRLEEMKVLMLEIGWWFSYHNGIWFQEKTQASHLGVYEVELFS